eukprot:s1463_g8.t1
MASSCCAQLDMMIFYGGEPVVSVDERGRSPASPRRQFLIELSAFRGAVIIRRLSVRYWKPGRNSDLPVPRGSAEPVARLTRRPVPLAVRQLRDFNRGP